MWRASSKSHYEVARHYFSSGDLLADFSLVRTRIITNYLFLWIFFRLNSTFVKQSRYRSFTLCRAEKNALKFYWDFPSWNNFGPPTSTEDGDGLKDKIHCCKSPDILLIWFLAWETRSPSLKPLQSNLGYSSAAIFPHSCEQPCSDGRNHSYLCYNCVFKGPALLRTTCISQCAYTC